MTGYFQIGGDLSSVTNIQLNEIKLFDSKIIEDRKRYINTDNESELKYKHNEIMKDILKKEKNLLGEKKYQIHPASDSNIIRQYSDLGIHFFIYNPTKKEYLKNNFTFSEITNDVEKFIWSLSIDQDEILEENKNLTINSKGKNIQNVTLLKIKANEKKNKDKISYYEKILMSNGNKILYFENYREKKIDLPSSDIKKEYFLNEEDYDEYIFELHPITNKYNFYTTNNLYSCNFKLDDELCENEDKIIGYNFDKDSIRHSKDYLYAIKGSEYFKCKKPCTDIGDWERVIDSAKYDEVNLNTLETNSDYKNPNKKIDYDTRISDNRKLLFYEDQDYINVDEKKVKGDLLKVDKLNVADGLDLSNQGDIKINSNLDLKYNQLDFKYTSESASKRQPLNDASPSPS